MKRLLFSLIFATACTIPSDVAAQGIFKKIKEKVNKAIGSEAEKKAGIPQDQKNDNANNSGKPSNKGGGGLSNTTPPDVKAQMAEAQTAHKAKQYSNARYALQQALMGVEIQLGRQILKSLPTTILALPADSLQDKVMSTQWGWSNLNIQRVYKNTADKQLTTTIGNAGIYSGIAAFYFANAATMQADGQKQAYKQVRVKGHKAIIAYEDNKGYTLIVSLGQTSMVVWECINFASETEVMSAANAFDIDGIKKMLGEQ